MKNFSYTAERIETKKKNQNKTRIRWKKQNEYSRNLASVYENGSEYKK